EQIRFLSENLSPVLAVRICEAAEKGWDQLVVRASLPAKPRLGFVAFGTLESTARFGNLRDKLCPCGCGILTTHTLSSVRKRPVTCSLSIDGFHAELAIARTQMARKLQRSAALKACKNA